MKKNYLIIIIILFTGFCLSFYYYSKVEEFTPVQFSIIHSSNLRGETEPCG